MAGNAILSANHSNHKGSRVSLTAAIFQLDRQRARCAGLIEQ